MSTARGARLRPVGPAMEEDSLWKTPPVKPLSHRYAEVRPASVNPPHAYSVLRDRLCH